jgi:hypothetical protein
MSWCQAPIWGPWAGFYSCQTFSSLLIRGLLSDERTILWLTVAAAARIAVFLRCESRGIHDHILLSKSWESHNLEGHVSIFIPPHERSSLVIPPRLRWTHVQSHVATDGQSVSMSKCWGRSGTCNQIHVLLPVRRLLSCHCGAPYLRRGRVCRLSVSESSLFNSSAVCVYNIYVEIFFQSLLLTADYALLVSISSQYHGSLDTWTVAQMTASNFKLLIFSVWGFPLSNIAYIFIFMIMNDFYFSPA